MKSIKFGIILYGISLMGMEYSTPIQTIASTNPQSEQSRFIKELDILPNPLHSLILDYCELEYSPIRTIEYKHPVQKVTYSSDNKYFATISLAETGNAITLHTTNDNQIISQFSFDFSLTNEKYKLGYLALLPSIEELLFSSDSKVLFCHTSNNMNDCDYALTWSTENEWKDAKKIIPQLTKGEYVGYSPDKKIVAITGREYFKIVFANKGSWLIQNYPGKVYVTDVQSRKILYSFDVSKSSHIIAISPNNSLIALTIMNGIELYNFPTGTNKVIIPLNSNKDKFFHPQIQFSHDGTKLFYAINEILYAYDLKTKTSYTLIEESERIASFYVNAQKQIAVATGNKVKIYQDFVSELITRSVQKNAGSVVKKD
jgi:WD40 repeat protein